MKAANGLFWQLYLRIVGALLLIAAIFLVGTGYLNYQTDIEDFYRDSREAASPVLQRWQRQQPLPAEMLDLLGELYTFRLTVESPEQLTQRLQRAELLEQVRDSAVYRQDDSDLYFAVYHHGDDQRALVVSDIDVDPEAGNISEGQRRQFRQELEEEAYVSTLINGLMLGGLLLIALVLMRQVYRINRQVDALVTTAEQWGRGHLAVRADEQLPSPLNQLAGGFNKMASELERSIGEQQVMAQAISHELRTPLSKMQLALELLSRQYPAMAEAPLAADLHGYVDELESLVDKILLLARLNYLQQDDERQPIEVTALVQQRLDALGPLAGDKLLDLQASAKVTLTANPFQLSLALDNLLANALRYCRQGLQISIDIDGQQLQIRIEDDGPGIPADSREQMLMPFGRLDESRQRKSGGHGLGLAIVDAVVRCHQGRLILGESSLGGLSVIMLLPLE